MISEEEDPGVKPVRIKLVIAYDGGSFAGWQVQRTGIGVQQRIEEALGKLFQGVDRIHGSSRTDTGVHARGMVAHVDIPVPELVMTPRKLVLAVNAHLPKEIRVMRAARVPATFHARFDASGKEYRYHVWNHPAHDPLSIGYTWHVTRPLDLSRMKKAAALLVGTHDFKAFSAQAGYLVRSTVRTLTRCQVHRTGSLVVFRIEGDGFLYKMCRGLVGTIVQAGLGKFDPEEVTEMLRSKDRRMAGMTAPAHGLVLWRVHYRAGQASRDLTTIKEDEEDE